MKFSSLLPLLPPSLSLFSLLSSPITDAIAVGGAAYGPGEGRILFKTVQCSGSESALLDCVFSSPSNSSGLCSSHLQDASVVCQSKDGQRVCESMHYRSQWFCALALAYKMN